MRPVRYMRPVPYNKLNYALFAICARYAILYYSLYIRSHFGSSRVWVRHRAVLPLWFPFIHVLRPLPLRSDMAVLLLLAILKCGSCIEHYLPIPAALRCVSAKLIINVNSVLPAALRCVSDKRIINVTSVLPVALRCVSEKLTGIIMNYVLAHATLCSASFLFLARTTVHCISTKPIVLVIYVLPATLRCVSAIFTTGIELFPFDIATSRCVSAQPFINVDYVLAPAALCCVYLLVPTLATLCCVSATIIVIRCVSKPPSHWNGHLNNEYSDGLTAVTYRSSVSEQDCACAARASCG